MDSFTVVLTTLFSISFIINITGNTLISYTILRIKTLRTPINMLMLNLSVADLTVGIFMAPRFIFIHSFSHPSGKSGSMLCTFLTGGTLMWCGAVASFFTLLYISVQRYYAIVHPLSFKGRLSMPRVKKVVIVSWLFAFLWVLPQILTRRYDDEKQFCVGKWPNGGISRAYSIGWFLLAVVIPLSVMAVIYPRIIKALWCTNCHVVEISQRVRMRYRKRLTKFIILMTSIYCCCWAPVTIVYCFAHFIPSISAAGSISHKVGILLAVMNSSFNPVLHGLQSRELQKNLKDTIRIIFACSKKGKIDVFPVKKSTFGDHENTVL